MTPRLTGACPDVGMLRCRHVSMCWCGLHHHLDTYLAALDFRRAATAQRAARRRVPQQQLMPHPPPGVFFRGPWYITSPHSPFWGGHKAKKSEKRRKEGISRATSSRHDRPRHRGHEPRDEEKPS